MDTFRHNYTRSDSGSYLVDNPARVDGDGNQIHLAAEIETALPGVVFTLHLIKDLVTVKVYGSNLDIDQRAILDQVISDHKNNV